MADTTIKVDSRVRDRLALLAAQRGGTIRDLVTELTEATPTSEELAERAEAATAYLREHVCPSLDDAALAAGRAFWGEIDGGQVPSELADGPGTRQHTPA